MRWRTKDKERSSSSPFSLDSDDNKPSSFKKYSFWALIFLVAINVIFICYVLPQPPPPLLRFSNRCSKDSPVQVFSPLPEVRPPTLVIYVYAESGPLKKSNLEFFLEYQQNGLCEYCKNVDYIFIVNGESTVTFPSLSNMEVWYRPNECGDFGAWRFMFDKLGEKYKKYKRFMFVNDTVRGPYINPTILELIKQKGDFHFSDIFATHLTNDTRLVGSYINCGGPVTYEGYAHVMSMSFYIDDVALELVLPLFQCYKTKNDTITFGEVGMSKQLINSNINIASLLYSYRGVDFRCNDEMRHNCNEQKDPAIDLWYFGISTNPMEVVFYKNTRKNSWRIQQLYEYWSPKPNEWT